MTAREVLDGMKGRLVAVSAGPWESSRGATSDGTEFVTTEEQKAAFLALSLNNDESPLWLVVSPDVIPAATGDGPKAQANAVFIAAAPTDVARLVAAVEAALSRADRWESIAQARERDNLMEGDPELWAENRTRAIALRSNAHNIRAAIENALTK